MSGGLLGALLLLVAEFTPLLEVHTALQRAPVASVTAGSHHSYALIPIAILAVLLHAIVWRTRNRIGLLAAGVLGLVALLIALLGDLPDAQAQGVVGSVATHLSVATAAPGTGFYLETLGSVLLLITAAAGLLLLAPPEPRTPRAPAPGSSPSGGEQV
ncbi:MAG: hypothetical protein M3016_10640 [Actinomycetota bacterium]|nr:hypothetical protein [Actinomycetota bacterium]